MVRTTLRSGLLIIALTLISSSAQGNYSWLVQNSSVFPDASNEVTLSFGDLNNDGSVDMVVGKHTDFRTGRTAVYQQTASGWDAGTEVFSGGNGNVCPVVGSFGGNNWLIVNQHGQGNSWGNLQFLRYDTALNCVESYSTGLNYGYFSWQVVDDIDGVAGNEVYFSNRSQLARCTWNGAGFTIDILGTDSNGELKDSLLCEDITGDGSKELVYLSYQGGVRGINVLSQDMSVANIADSIDATIGSGQFDLSTSGQDIVYYNPSNSTLNMVEYNSSTSSYSTTLIDLALDNVRVLDGFDIDLDGVDELLIGLSTGEILSYDFVSQSLTTQMTTGIYWGDSVVADWGEGDRLVFSGSENGNISVVAFGTEAAPIPEPSSIALLAIGIVGRSIVRSRKKEAERSSLAA